MGNTKRQTRRPRPPIDPAFRRQTRSRALQPGASPLRAGIPDSGHPDGSFLPAGQQPSGVQRSRIRGAGRHPSQAQPARRQPARKQPTQKQPAPTETTEHTIRDDPAHESPAAMNEAPANQTAPPTEAVGSGIIIADDDSSDSSGHNNENQPTPSPSIKRDRASNDDASSPLSSKRARRRTRSPTAASSGSSVVEFVGEAQVIKEQHPRRNVVRETSSAENRPKQDSESSSEIDLSDVPEYRPHTRLRPDQAESYARERESSSGSFDIHMDAGVLLETPRSQGGHQPAMPPTDNEPRPERRSTSAEFNIREDTADTQPRTPPAQIQPQSRLPLADIEPQARRPLGEIQVQPRRSTSSEWAIREDSRERDATTQGHAGHQNRMPLADIGPPLAGDLGGIERQTETPLGGAGSRQARRRTSSEFNVYQDTDGQPTTASGQTGPQPRRSTTSSFNNIMNENEPNPFEDQPRRPQRGLMPHDRQVLGELDLDPGRSASSDFAIHLDEENQPAIFNDAENQPRQVLGEIETHPRRTASTEFDILVDENQPDPSQHAAQQPRIMYGLSAHPPPPAGMVNTMSTSPEVRSWHSGRSSTERPEAHVREDDENRPPEISKDNYNHPRRISGEIRQQPRMPLQAMEAQLRSPTGEFQREFAVSPEELEHDSSGRSSVSSEFHIREDENQPPAVPGHTESQPRRLTGEVGQQPRNPLGEIGGPPDSGSSSAPQVHDGAENQQRSSSDFNIHDEGEQGQESNLNIPANIEESLSSIGGDQENVPPPRMARNVESSDAELDGDDKENTLPPLSAVTPIEGSGDTSLRTLTPVTVGPPVDPRGTSSASTIYQTVEGREASPVNYESLGQENIPPPSSPSAGPASRAQATINPVPETNTWEEEDSRIGPIAWESSDVEGGDTENMPPPPSVRARRSGRASLAGRAQVNNNRVHPGSAWEEDSRIGPIAWESSDNAGPETSPATYQGPRSGNAPQTSRPSTRASRGSGLASNARVNINTALWRSTLDDEDSRIAPSDLEDSDSGEDARENTILEFNEGTYSPSVRDESDAHYDDENRPPMSDASARDQENINPALESNNMDDDGSRADHFSRENSHSDGIVEENTVPVSDEGASLLGIRDESDGQYDDEDSDGGNDENMSPTLPNTSTHYSGLAGAAMGVNRAPEMSTWDEEDSRIGPIAWESSDIKGGNDANMPPPPRPSAGPMRRVQATVNRAPEENAWEEEDSRIGPVAWETSDEDEEENPDVAVNFVQIPDIPMDLNMPTWSWTYDLYGANNLGRDTHPRWRSENHEFGFECVDKHSCFPNSNCRGPKGGSGCSVCHNIWLARWDEYFQAQAALPKLVNASQPGPDGFDHRKDYLGFLAEDFARTCPEFERLDQTEGGRLTTPRREGCPRPTETSNLPSPAPSPERIEVLSSSRKRERDGDDEDDGFPRKFAKK